MAANMLSMAADLLKSGKYSDCTLRCNGRDFSLHKNIENHSPIFRADQFGQIHLEAMINYMYIGDKCPKDVHSLQGLPSWDAKADGAAKGPEETLEAALYYIRLNTVANFFQVSGLVQATCKCLQASLDSFDNLNETQILKLNAIIISAIQHNSDAQVQDIVAGFAARHMKHLVDHLEYLKPVTVPFTNRILKAMVSEVERSVKTEPFETADYCNVPIKPCENCQVARQLESEAIEAGSRVEGPRGNYSSPGRSAHTRGHADRNYKG